MAANSQASTARLHAAHVEARRRAASGSLTVDMRLMSGGNLVTKNVEKLTSDPVVRWTENMVRSISFDYTADVVQTQERLGNPPQQFLFDESPTLDPMLQRRTIDAIFDRGRNVREIMNALLAEARKRVPYIRWGWKTSAGPNSDARILSAQVQGNGPVNMNYGDRIYLVPVQMASGPTDATYANLLYMDGNGRDGMNRRKRKSKRRAKGFYGLTTQAVRRRAKGAGVHVKAVHSFKYAGPFRKLPDGVSIGQRGPGRSSRYPSQQVFYQGTWAFSLSLMRGKFSTNRRG